MARLGDVFLHIRNGANIKQGLDDTGYPITRIETISNRVVNREKMGYAGITDVNKYSDFVLQDGDILMSHINSEIHLGKAALYEKEDDEIIIHGMNLLLLRPNKDLITSKYAFYYLSSLSFLRQIPNITKKSVNQASFTVSALKELAFPLTSIEEQKKITLDLDKVNGLISLRKQQLAKLDELVKSRFIELFGTIHDNKLGYEIKTLQDVCEQIKDGTHQTPTYTDDSVNGYKFLSSKDVTTGKIDWMHLKYIPEELHNELFARIAPRKGDVLLAKNGTTGIAAIVDRDEIFDIYVSLALLRPIEINSVYLWAAINSVETKQQFDASLKGIGVPNLHLGEIKKAKIIVPPKEEQKRFAAFVEQTDKSKFEIQQSLEKLETLKKALMQKYFG
jgi:type I restriction enzyme S subunit